MDTVQRVIFGWLIPALAYGLLCMFVGLMANEAFADEYTPTFKWRSDSYSGFFPERDTYQEVLEDNKTKLNENGANYQLISTVVLNPSYVYGNYSEGGATFQRGANRIAYCNYGGSLTGSGAENNQKCTNAPPCPEGQTRQPNGSCGAPPPPECEPGCNGACGSTQIFLNFRSLACIDSCIYRLGEAMGLRSAPNSDIFHYYHTVKENTGASCEPVPDTPEPEPEPSPCPECACAKQGKSWGTVNGVVVCHSPGTPGSQPVMKKDPPTIKTETPAPTPENPNPEPVTTETPAPIITITPNPAGGSPDITETVTNPDGSTTSTSQPQQSYCQKNPTAKLCKDSDNEEAKGSWGGGCGAFQCEGDAVNCAIARKIHQDHCDAMESLLEYAPAVSEGGRILTGNQDEGVRDWLAREGDHTRTINLANEIKETGEYSFSASCWNDLTVNIMGAAFTLPLSKLCSLFEMLGFALLAASYLWALRIVGIF